MHFFLMDAPTIDVAGAIAALTSLGVLPVITLAAVIGVATMLYKRFRK
jgi:hypothetical protein